jgi:iron uptake system EfeUOB component EfeO/EfeM
VFAENAEYSENIYDYSPLITASGRKFEEKNNGNFSECSKVFEKYKT